MTYRLVIKSNQLNGDRISLNADQIHYLRRVLRLRNSDCFVAMDGAGKAWQAQLIRDEAILLSQLDDSTELPVPVVLIAAMPKGNGFEGIVHAAVELGVREIIPVSSQRTLLNPSANRLQRWRKIATEAAEQSERMILPTVAEPMPVTKAITLSVFHRADRYFCVARSQEPHLMSYLQAGRLNSIVIATGPEGGWTDSEVEAAIATDYKVVSLGDRILRAVTAPVTALSLINASFYSTSRKSPQ